MDDRCVSCGALIPEGRQICWACEHQFDEKEGKVVSKKCAICGMPLDSGLVVHPDCVPQWHPASEPPILDDNAVLVIVNGRFGSLNFEEALEIAFYSELEGWILEHYPDWKDPDVRCWMDTDALPEPPKEMLR